MNRFATAIGISLLTLSSLAGVARAEMWPGADIQQAHLDSAVKALKSKQFAVVDISTLDKSDAMSNPDSYAANTKALQKAIGENKTLKEALKAQDVELRNVVAVDEAADGGFTFYVK